MITIESILEQIQEHTKNNEEVCLSFMEVDNEHLWVHKTNENYFLDSESLFDSSEFPSEIEHILKENGIEIIYEPVDWLYGYHAIVTEKQLRDLLLIYSVSICGVRKNMDAT